MNLREVGFVDELHGEYAIVRVAKKSACGENCASCKGGCTPGERRIKVKNPISVDVGDRVILETPAGKVLSAAFLAYILPIIIFFVGFFVGENIFEHELLSVFVGVIFAGVCFCGLYFFNKKAEEKYLAEIVSKVE